MSLHHMCDCKNIQINKYRRISKGVYMYLFITSLYALKGISIFITITMLDSVILLIYFINRSH